MFIVLLAVSLAPALALSIYFYHKDKYQKEPLRFLLKTFFYGFFSVIIIAIIEFLLSVVLLVIKQKIFQILYLSFIVAGVAEESFKFLIFRLFVYNAKEFDEPYDGIIYSVMISLGLASLENIMYVFQNFLFGSLNAALMTGLVRAILTVPGHCFFGIIMGYFFSKAKFTEDKQFENYLMLKGLALAIFLHGLFDFICLSSSSMIFSTLLLIALMPLCVYLVKGAINESLNNSPFKDKNIDDTL